MDNLTDNLQSRYEHNIEHRQRFGVNKCNRRRYKKILLPMHLIHYKHKYIGNKVYCLYIRQRWYQPRLSGYRGWPHYI